MSHFSIRVGQLGLALSPLVLLLAEACTTNEGDNIYNQGGAGPMGADGKDGRNGKDGDDGDSGKDGKDGRDGTPGRDGRDGRDGESSGTGGKDPGLPDEYPSNLPECDEIVPLPELEIDLFGKDGHSFYFEVTPEMRDAQDNQLCDYSRGGPPYQLGDEVATCPPAAFNVRIVPSGSTTCTDTGRVGLDLPGQSSWKSWSEIPNFKLKTDEFEDQKFATGDKNLRFNNGQAESTIVREATALAIWRAMGHPAPPTRFVKTQSNVWDYDFKPGVYAAHVMVQPYKKAFFSSQLPNVTDAWEGEGNPFSGYDSLECEWSKEDDCDRSKLDEVVQVANNAPWGDGFMAATSEVIDWELVHKNMCLSALTGTGDDWIHNTNNVVIALGKNGKIFYLPYSTDISGGHPWYPNTRYDEMWDSSNPAGRCLIDSECRTQALDACDVLIDEFVAFDVVKNIVEERCEALETAELARPADGPVCESLAKFYDRRPSTLREELDEIRDGGGMGGQGGTSSSGGAYGSGGFGAIGGGFVGSGGVIIID